MRPKLTWPSFFLSLFVSQSTKPKKDKDCTECDLLFFTYHTHITDWLAEALPVLKVIRSGTVTVPTYNDRLGKDDLNRHSDH